MPFDYFDRLDVISLTGESFDQFMAFGFRHFGKEFYRYQTGFHNDELVTVLPLRIVLEEFHLSKSQRKTKNKNQDLTSYFEPVHITKEMEDLFYKHINRFQAHIPDSIYTFLGENAESPTSTVQCVVREGEKLVAVSFLDIGAHSTSSIYGMFDLEYSKRRLGIYTMLLEIQYSMELQKVYYYPGYAYSEKSFYDYKKTFHGMEYLNWEKEKWLPFQRLEE